MTEQVNALNKNVKTTQKNVAQILDMKLLNQKRKLVWTAKNTEKKVVKPILAAKADPVGPGTTSTVLPEGLPKMKLRQRLEQNKEWQQTKGKGIE